MVAQPKILGSFPFLEKNHGKLLVVDDEPIVREVLYRFLDKCGYYVETAEDGADALEKIKKTPYDVVITDLKMPGTDGRELLKIMEKNYNDIPRIVLTGQESNTDILLALKTGAYDYITKPINDFDLLIHSVQRALERKKLSVDKNRALIQLEMINDFISIINSGVDTEEIFKMISVSLKNIIPFNWITLASYDWEEESLVIRLAGSDNNKSLGVGDELPFENLVMERGHNHTGVTILPDLKAHFEKANLRMAGNVKLMLQDGLKSAAVMSLTIEDKLWGFLIFACDELSGYNEEHVAFLQSIAGHVALSIQRGELLTELEIHTEHLEHLVKVRTHEVLKTQKKTIFALSKLAEMRDAETGGHLERIRSYSIVLAQLLKYSGRFDEVSNDYIKDIYDCSILHDIGKVGVPDEILLKKGSFEDGEYDIIKRHATIGYDALQIAAKDLGENTFMDMAKDVVLYHHERWDGSGYPVGLKGEDIPLSARIIAIVDVYDALVSDRPYKKAISHDETLAIMKKQANHFDPTILSIFIENSKEFDKIRKELS
jgi:response regulator RpfG family c-di-GMP phosphodiesterase